MRRFPVVVCLALLLLGGVAPSVGLAGRFDILFARRDPLGVIEGKVRVVCPPPEDYSWELLRSQGEPGTIRVLEPKKWTGRYLAYDPEGKDKAVFLAEKQSLGTKWVLTRVEGGSSTYTIRAAEGELKGWYLDVEEKGEKLVSQKGETSTAYRAFLSEKPKRVPQVVITEVAP